LFVSRKFPPSVGGMETLAKDVAASLEGVCDLTVLALGRSRRHLLWWLPTAVARTLWQAGVRRRHDVVLLGDAVMNTALGPLLSRLRVPHATMIMGLDVTWQAPGYRRLVRRPLAACPRVIAISRATAAAAADLGVPEGRTTVLRLAIEPPPPGPSSADARERLRTWLDLPEDAFVVMTLGRVVRRKGMAWFAEEVLPKLPSDVYYVVAGTGADLPALRGIAARDPHLRLTGPVDDATREVLFRGADLFVQPNVPVAGDMEGFGLVTLEATVRGLPVLASDLEGIRDVVRHGITGWVVPSGDVDAWRERILAAADDPDATSAAGRRFAEAATREFSRERMGRDLVALLPSAQACEPSVAGDRSGR
jgi:glycosyltransferase involved in cell wall biosynthesis